MAKASPQEIWSRGDYQKIASEHVIVSEKLCVAAAISSAHKVLDVACGTGNTALAAARRRAAVTGIDIAPALIERARRRAEAEGLDGIDFQVGDAAALPFADGAFDVVLSTFGSSFLPDQPQAARELMRVTRPGGVIALTAYTPQSLPSDVYRLGCSIAPPPENAPLPAYVWTDGARAAELLGPGCAHIRIVPDSVDACFASAEAFFDNNSSFYGPVMTRLAGYSAEQRARFRDGMIAILNDHNRATDGTLMAVFDYATISAIRTAEPMNQE
jgi:SAM-dependent methyltransferase